MKAQYKRVQLYATQGGGTCTRDSYGDFYFHDVPNWGDYRIGDPVPEEWSVHAIYATYTLQPKAKRELKSRNRSEGVYVERRQPWNRKHKVRRIHKKKAKLAFNGTMRSITRPRIKAVMHMVEIDMAREEKRKQRKGAKT